MEERTKNQHQLTINKPLQDSQRFGHTYFILQTGVYSCDTTREIERHLHKHTPGLQKVDTVEECDVIFVFCPIVSQAGTDMDAALDQLNTCSESKPAVFMVLHHTYDQEKTVPDSSKYIKRRNTLTVNFLFNEDDGLLKCDMNHEALSKITEHFKTQWQKVQKNWFTNCAANMLFCLQVAIGKVKVLWQQEKNCIWFIIRITFNILFQVIFHGIKMMQKVIGTFITFQTNKAERHTYFILQIGVYSCDATREIERHLHKHTPGLQKVDTVEECDVIFVFCPIVSRAGTDMDAALDQLNTCSESKPAVFMVLHHTYDQEKTVPDSSKYIKRRNTLTVNFLFNEDDGLLKCDMNHEALTKITEHFKPQRQKVLKHGFTDSGLKFGLQVATGKVPICLRFIFSCVTNMQFWIQAGVTKIKNRGYIQRNADEETNA